LLTGVDGEDGQEQVSQMSARFFFDQTQYDFLTYLVDHASFAPVRMLMEYILFLLSEKRAYTWGKEPHTFI
jgi:hypothetical protein